MAAEEKQLAFSVRIDGVSNEATEIAKLTVQLKNLKQERNELIEQASSPGHIASKEELQKLAAYNKEIGVQDAALKTLKRTVDSASDSLARKKALLIELTENSNKASSSIAQGMAPAINKLNQEIKNGEEARGVFTRNVGNYPQLFSMIPGPVGTAASSIIGFTGKLAAVGPVGAVIAAGIAAISAPVIGFLKWTQEGMDLLAVKTSEFNASIRVLKGELANLGKNEIAEANKPGGILSFLGSVWDFYKKIELGGLKIIAPEAAKKIEDTAEKMKEASAAAKVYTDRIHEIEQAEIDAIVPREKATEQIKAARLAYQEGNGTVIEKLALFDKALTSENQITAQEIKNANDRADALHTFNLEKAKSIPLTRDEERTEQEAFAQAIRLQSESESRLIRFAGIRKKLQKEAVDGEKELTKAEETALKAKIGIDTGLDKGTSNPLMPFTWTISDQVATVNYKNQVKKNIDDIEGIIKISDQGLEQRQKEHNRIEIEMEKKKQEVKLEIYKNASDLLNNTLEVLFGKSKLVQATELVAEKALAIAQIIIHTQEANAAMTAWGATYAIPTAGVSIAFAQAMNIKNRIEEGISIAAVIAATAAGLVGIGTGKAKGGRITSGIPVYTGTKDDTLIVANKSETVLTDRHVAMLGGSGVMHRIGVPGYAMGGYVGSQAPQIAPAGLNVAELERIFSDRIDRLEVRLDTNKVRASLFEVEVINRTKRI
jgi:hypothetical protein